MFGRIWHLLSDSVDGFIALLRDMTAFPLNRLYAANADPLR